MGKGDDVLAERWDYFYDDVGENVIKLVRRLIRLGRQQTEFRYGDHFFYNDHDCYQSKTILFLSLKYINGFSLIALNFGNQEEKARFIFPTTGDYREKVHGFDNLKNIVAGQGQGICLSVPSNYGII